MNLFVVDTNVAVVANGRNIHVSHKCQQKCVEKIESIMENGVLVVDTEDLILEEYSGRLEFSGEPSVGDKLFIHLVNCQYQEDRVKRVSITPSRKEGAEFAELPRNKLDRSDQKFLAVAVVSGAIIVNATDSDWDEHRALTEGLGVKVDQLCPAYANK